MIVGYGRVGSVVGKGLLEQGLPIVVIEQDRRRVEELRAHGISVVYGDATTAGVLEAAGAGAREADRGGDARRASAPGGSSSSPAS